MKTYRGRRIEFPGSLPTWEVTVENRTGNGLREVSALKHKVRHSPDGFAWGYGGSGPSDLSRSILWDLLEQEPDERMYKAFTQEVVAEFWTTWALSEQAIHAWIDNWSSQYDFENSNVERTAR